MTNNHTPHITKEEIFKEFDEKFKHSQFVNFSLIKDFLSHSLDQYADSKLVEVLARLLEEIGESNGETLSMEASANKLKDKLRDIIKEELNHNNHDHIHQN